LCVGGGSHLDLLLVVEDALLVSLVYGRGSRAVERSAVLVAQLRIFGFLGLKCLFTRTDHVEVDLLQVCGALDGLREVLGSTLALELFNLGPNGVRHVVAGGSRVQDLGESELLKVGTHLFILFSNLGKLTLDDLLEHILKLSFESSDSWRRHSAELGVDLCLLVELVAHGDEVDEVLRVKLGQLARGNVLLVVNLFVVVDSFCEHCLCLLELASEVGEVGATASLSVALRISELFHADSEVSDCEVHGAALLASLEELGRAQLPVGHSAEVAAVIPEHIRHLPVVEGSQIRINLVSLEGLLKVDGDLGGNLGENAGGHTCVTRLLEEEVLGLGQAEVAVLVQRLLVEVAGVGVGGQLSRHREKLLEDPGGLAEAVASSLDALACEVHVAAAAAQAHSEVVQGGEGGEESGLRLHSLASEGVMGNESQVARR